MPNHAHFLTGEEFSREELSRLIDTAIAVKNKRQQDTLRDKKIALVFDKPSLRTRVSFTVAIQELGGTVIEINASERKGEDPEDFIRVLQGYVDGAMVRTFAHSTLDRMAKHSSIPLINGLSDSHHPCQVLADLQTLKEKFGQLEGLKVAYIGDGNNMLNSLLLLLPYLGVSIQYACPQGYKPDPEVLSKAHARAAVSGASIQEFSTCEEACHQVDAIYTDVWTSMGSEGEAKERAQAFQNYQINSALYARAKKHALIMHCMPMNKGQEITDEMIEHPNSVLFHQSENRMHAQKALLMRLYATP